MSPAVSVLVLLTVSSIVLSVIFAIAWVRFGQPRHALTWSIAYAIASAGWLLAFADGLWLPALPLFRALVLALGLFHYATLTLGFRQRADLPTNLPVLFGLTAIAVGAVGGRALGLLPDGGLGSAPMPLACGILIACSARTLVGRGEETNAAEGAAFVVLILFAIFNLAMALGWLLEGSYPTPPWRDTSTILVGVGTPMAFTTLGFFAVFLLAADLAEKMRRLAILDPLTAILNRRGLEQAATAAIANCRRVGCTLTLALADLDRFKQINDTFGHAAGDRALQRFVRHVEGMIRKGDCFGRVGGEEFAIMLMNSTPEDAMEVTERIRQGLETLDIIDDVRLTASFGVAGMGQHDLTLADLMVRADAALYRSKMDGRNRVTLAEDPRPRVAGGGTAAPPAARLQPARPR